MRDPFWTNYARRLLSDLKKFQLLDELELLNTNAADIRTIFATVRTCREADKPVHKNLLHWLKFMEQCPKSFDAIVNTMIHELCPPILNGGVPPRNGSLERRSLRDR